MSNVSTCLPPLPASISIAWASEDSRVQAELSRVFPVRYSVRRERRRPFSDGQLRLQLDDGAVSFVPLGTESYGEQSPTTGNGEARPG